MRRRLPIAVAALIAATVTPWSWGSGLRPAQEFAGQYTGEASAPEAALSLWYRRPAQRWVEALPIGNGRLGGMVFGGVTRERIQLNEDTLWAGAPYDPTNPEALAALPEARRLIFEGRYTDADTLIGQKMMAQPLRQMPYETVGDLRLRYGQVLRDVKLNRGEAFRWDGR